MCEKFNIDPLFNFVGRDGVWNSDEGRALKILLYAYCLLNNEEERRALDEAHNGIKDNNNANGGRR
ncbi:MAG: hypothetical protein Q8910_00430 [Bacteroidota bacterium]|nr:hypothetical protein [Bacteroidota bacterium]